MQKDFVETTNDNPIVNLLANHDALDLIDENTSSLYPQIWGLCEFERKGLDYIGEYESPEKPIKIKYEISQTPMHKDILICEATAALKYWTHWQSQFPKDFIEVLVQNSPTGKIFPYKEVTLFQQLTFTEVGIEWYRALITYIYKDWEIIPVYKINHRPTTIGSPII